MATPLDIHSLAIQGSSACSPSEFVRCNATEMVRTDDPWKPPWLMMEPVPVGLKQEGVGVKSPFSRENYSSLSNNHEFLSSCLSYYTSCHMGSINDSVNHVGFLIEQGLCISLEIFFHLLQRCIHSKEFAAIKEVHKLIVRNGLDANAFLECHIIRAYALFDCLDMANQVFRKALNPSIFSWSAIISAHANLGQGHKALDLYDHLEGLSVEPDGYVFVAALKACISTADLIKGRLIHSHIIKYGLDHDMFTINCLVGMYVESGSLHEGTTLFYRLISKNVDTWNYLIAGYNGHGQFDEALGLFRKMNLNTMVRDNLPEDGNGVVQSETVKPNVATFIFVLKACMEMAALDQGQWIHSCIVEWGFESCMSVANTLIDMYGKCGSAEDACTVFDRLSIRDVVTWSVLIAAYVQDGRNWDALKLLHDMQDDDVIPDGFTFVCALKACASLTALEHGKDIHHHILESNRELDLFVGSTLVDMYSKCGRLHDARMQFDLMPNRGEVTWNVMVSGYVQHGHGQEALELFYRMQKEGIKPDQHMFASVLKACSMLGALEEGIQIHAQVVKSGFELDLFVKTALLDLYGKSGNMEDARVVFDKFVKPDVVAWNALIAACAQHNAYHLAANYFKEMQQAGLEPDGSTFICLLSACSHAGLIEEGCLHFKCMRDIHQITPTLEHYDSMVDILGHAGSLYEAEDLLESVPFAPLITQWTSLLSSCRTYGNVEIGERCFDRFVTMDHGNAAGYVLMSNIYAHAGLEAEAEEIEQLRRSANGWKKPARAFIEVDNQVHGFTVSGKTHPQSDQIYAKLSSLSVQMPEEGYVPRLDLVLETRNDDVKEAALCGHSEKLAIAFGLICTPMGTTLRVSKNLRVCGDCHNASKIISKIEKREIIIRDAYRSHHFKDGCCSCKDTY